MNKVTVKIAKEEYTIIGEEKKEYLLQLASLVDEEIENTLRKNPRLSQSKGIILSAINIADKYFSVKESMVAPKKEYDLLKQKIKILETDIEQKNNEIKKLRQVWDENSTELNNLDDIKKEFEDRIAQQEKRVQEADEIINKFQNHIYRLQLEIDNEKMKLK